MKSRQQSCPVLCAIHATLYIDSISEANIDNHTIHTNEATIDICAIHIDEATIDIDAIYIYEATIGVDAIYMVPLEVQTSQRELVTWEWWDLWTHEGGFPYIQHVSFFSFSFSLIFSFSILNTFNTFLSLLSLFCISFSSILG